MGQEVADMVTNSPSLPETIRVKALKGYNPRNWVSGLDLINCKTNAGYCFEKPLKTRDSVSIILHV